MNDLFLQTVFCTVQLRSGSCSTSSKEIFDLFYSSSITKGNRQLTPSTTAWVLFVAFATRTPTGPPITLYFVWGVAVSYAHTVQPTKSCFCALCKRTVIESTGSGKALPGLITSCNH